MATSLKSLQSVASQVTLCDLSHWQGEICSHALRVPNFSVFTLGIAQWKLHFQSSRLCSSEFSGQIPSPSLPWWWLLLMRVLGDLRSLNQDWQGSPGKALQLDNWYLNARGCWQAWLHKALDFIIPAPRPCVIVWMLKDSQSAKSWELVLPDNGSSVKSQQPRLKQYKFKRTCLGSCIL